MYHDIKQIYWYDGMKNDIGDYVAKCPNFQQVNEEHLKTGVLTQKIKIQTWKQESSNMGFVFVFRGLGDNMTPYELLWTR